MKNTDKTIEEQVKGRNLTEKQLKIYELIMKNAWQSKNVKYSTLTVDKKGLHVIKDIDLDIDKLINDISQALAEAEKKGRVQAFKEIMQATPESKDIVYTLMKKGLEKFRKDKQ